jgi:hypothetical protein
MTGSEGDLMLLQVCLGSGGQLPQRVPGWVMAPEKSDPGAASKRFDVATANSPPEHLGFQIGRRVEENPV